ncbi:hypothetical protein [Paenibacillus sinopodophylli]|uniref:hypothetical protein n=1 Tax=Paenibacillus sinopodophylli TaxID=1837342 RepID=UPI00110CEAC5|nr:hypothetical protein [Paenibacillus sinopodophylli]
MGGKNNLLDSRLLNALYQESLHFNDEAEARLKAVQKELNRLNDLLVQGSAQEVQQGTLTRESVQSYSDKLALLRNAKETAQTFIESRLSDAVLIEKRMQAKSSEGSQSARGSQADLFLRK